MKTLQTLINPTLTGLILLIIAAMAVTPVSASDSDEASGSLAWMSHPEFASGDQIEVVVFLDDSEVENQVYRSAQDVTLTRSDRIRQVSSRLRSFHSAHEQSVRSFIESNSTSDIKTTWIVPAISARMSREAVAQLASMPGVKSVVPNVRLENIEPVDDQPASLSAASVAGHLTMIGAPAAWQRGITGRGRLVCSFDTGVDEVHPALQSKWRGNSTPLSEAWFSTISPESVPADRSGHGTHTMGIMVGSEAGDTVGVAPGAEWITAGVIDQGKTLSATVLDIILAFQWVLNPDGNWGTTDDVPDVILNSWGVPAGLFGPCDNTFWQVIDNVEAAGIVTIFAAGNEGPNPQTLRNPANRATTPLNSFSVGAVDGDKVVASFSSRGPSVCNGVSSIKPEVTAPGVSIRSAAKGGGYRLMSGTSMAAPVVAGMVALARQYKPNATVEQIKWAIIRSCEDLGEAGEDNNYGYGLVNAGRMLDNLAEMTVPELILTNAHADGDVVVPGDTATLSVTISNRLANIESVRARILPVGDAGVTLIQDETEFYFGSGTTAAASTPLTVAFSTDMYNGQTVDFELEVTDGGIQILDTLSFEIKIGYAPAGLTADHTAGHINLTVSDFGQYGLAPGSIYNVNGLGLRYENSDNLLYEAGLILARSSLQVSSSVRGDDGRFAVSDFVPEQSLMELASDAQQGVHRRARMTDDKAEVSIPVTVSQETVDYKAAQDDGIVIFRYWLINESLERLTNLHFGFLADFDLPGGEFGGYVAERNLLYTYNAAGRYVGFCGLEHIDSYQLLDNGDRKAGLPAATKYSIVSASTSVDNQMTGDLYTVISTGPIVLEPRDSVQVVFALVAGNSAAELANRSIHAGDLYQIPTDVAEDGSMLPDEYELAQNYPNPFNPTTTISFSLPQAGEVTLDIYNTLGQKVKRLVSGTHAAGTHIVEWDGTSDRGDEVATGVYLYRLSAGSYTESRKMVLLK